MKRDEEGWGWVVRYEKMGCEKVCAVIDGGVGHERVCYERMDVFAMMSCILF